MSHAELSMDGGKPLPTIHVAPLPDDRQHLIDRFVALMSGPGTYKEKMAHEDALLIMQFSQQERDRCSIAFAQTMSSEELESDLADTLAFEAEIRQAMQ